jgi:large subunit ribosomal protein L6
MSRIGKAPIKLPAGVDFKINSNNLVSIKGPKGELHQQIDADITVTLTDNEILVTRPTDHKRHRALHGLYRSLII